MGSKAATGSVPMGSKAATGSVPVVVLLSKIYWLPRQSSTGFVTLPAYDEERGGIHGGIVVGEP